MTRFIPITYAARNLGRSPVRLALSVGGACAVALLAMAGAGFALGMEGALRASGHERNVILLGAGSEESVERSEIPQATAGVRAARRNRATTRRSSAPAPRARRGWTLHAWPARCATTAAAAHSCWWTGARAAWSASSRRRAP